MTLRELGTMRPLRLYLVDDDGNRFFWTLGWDDLAKQIVVSDNIHADCRWAFAVDQKRLALQVL